MIHIDGCCYQWCHSQTDVWTGTFVPHNLNEILSYNVSCSQSCSSLLLFNCSQWLLWPHILKALEINDNRSGDNYLSPKMLNFTFQIFVFCDLLQLFLLNPVGSWDINNLFFHPIISDMLCSHFLLDWILKSHKIFDLLIFYHLFRHSYCCSYCCCCFFGVSSPPFLSYTIHH